jgi:thiol-disulfide isomerase/thioredoxin
MRNRRSPSAANPTGPVAAPVPARMILAVAAWPCLWLATAAAPCAAEPQGGATAGDVPVLHLADGGFVPGKLVDSDREGVLRWQGTPFVDPFDFDIDAVNTIHRPGPSGPPKPAGDFCFDLATGDVLFGSLVDLDATNVVLDVPRLGRVQVWRSQVRRITRWRGGAELVYLGPNGLSGWRDASAEKGKAWREESGALVADQDGAALFADLGIPARSAIEFDVSWKGKADFVIALGVNDDEVTARKAFRFEVWENDLVALRETDGEADVASVARVSSGRVNLRAYLDQGRGRLVVVSADGKTLADLHVSDHDPRSLTGVRLENKGGEVRLERLCISAWDGAPPRGPTASGSGLWRTDGSAVSGEVARYDAASKAFVIRPRDGSEEIRVPEDQVSSVTLSTPEVEDPRSVRVVLHDGTRISGEWLRVEKGEVWLTVPGFKEALHLPVDELRMLVVFRRTPSKPTPRLEMDGVRLAGRLVDGPQRPGASCLAWQPHGSATASPLRPGASGRIVFKEPPPPAPTSPPQATRRVVIQQMQAAGGGMIEQMVVVGEAPGVLRNTTTSIGPARSRAEVSRRSLYLRTGDIIPAEVTKIDEEGVTFRSPVSASAFVPHGKIKAVELAAGQPTTTQINKAKRDRLLMLPRMQKGSPPTQLIRSKNGDYLRGRVIAMDDKTLRVEVRLETREIPRDRVARIIWLHADEAGAPGATPPAPAAAPPARGDGSPLVQAVRSDGTRITFSADLLEGQALAGRSDVMGACRVRLDDLDRLLINDAIAREAAQLAYQQWRLQDAPEPKVAQGDGAASPGADSALVGKPAPDFQLELLDGTKFRLSESKGRVVVLDFWATWCGPCLQAMPQVDRVVREFHDRGVRLVAVNLQEAPREITAMLERHKLSPAVALDRDGVVAEKYGVTAIPQTVVIDRDGNVARLYVGGGPHLGDQLRDLIRDLLPDADSGGP